MSPRKQRAALRVSARACSVAALATLAMAGPAGADSRVNGRLTGGPLLAGNQAAWVESRGAPSRVVLGGGRGSPRTVFRAPGGGLYAFAASRRWLAFDFAQGRDEGRSGFIVTPHLRVGPLRGPFTEVRSDCADPQATELNGNALATVEGVGGTCEGQLGSTGGVLLREPPTAAPREIALASGRSPLAGTPLRIAGRYVAWLGTDRPYERLIYVYDHVAGRDLYRVRIATRITNTPLAFDLQDDGKLVVAWEDGGPIQARWYSAAEPRQHRLPFRLRRHAVRIAGDRILFDRLLPRRGRVRRSELTLSTLRGHATRVASFSSSRRGRTRVGLFDFDAARIAWASRTNRRGAPTRVHLRRAP